MAFQSGEIGVSALQGAVEDQDTGHAPIRNHRTVVKFVMEIQRRPWLVMNLDVVSFCACLFRELYC